MRFWGPKDRKDMSDQDARRAARAEELVWIREAGDALDRFMTTEYEGELTRLQETLRGDQPMTTRTLVQHGKLYGPGGKYVFDQRIWRNMQFILPQVLEMNMRALIPNTGGAVQMNVDGMITQIRTLEKAPTARGGEAVDWKHWETSGAGGLRGKIEKLYDGFQAAGTTISDPVPKLRGCIRDLIISMGAWEEWRYTPEGRDPRQRSTVIAESATNAQRYRVDLLPMNDMVEVENAGQGTLEGFGSALNFVHIRGADGKHLDPFNTEQQPLSSVSSVSHAERRRSGEQLSHSHGTGMSGPRPGYHGTRNGVVVVGDDRARAHVEVVGDGPDGSEFAGYD